MYINDVMIIREKTPVWHDKCQHGIDSYICSFENIYNYNKELYKEMIDIYVFGDSDICLRYGNEPHEYYSPGNIVNVYSFAHIDEKYNAVVKILNYFGKIVWKKNE